VSEDRRLILGTFNPGKGRELAWLLRHAGLRVCTLAEVDAAREIEEEGRSLAENACLKAAGQARHLGQWVLGDDTGLLVDALGGAPGLHTARYAGPGATSAANRRRLLEELAGVPLERRTARFVCHLALADPQGTIRAQSEGCCRGRILLEPTGDGGFGYDPLFQIVEYHRSFAQLGEAAKSYLSHRARAVQGMLPHLSLARAQ